MDLAERIIALVSPQPAVRDIRLVGSRAEGRATERSDWDFRVESSHFATVADSLPTVFARLDPLAQQWDRLSPHQCWMAILPGPIKVDLIFPDESHALEPPWRAGAENLSAIDAHFWDWTLWLSSKEAASKDTVVAAELDKLFDHLLAPLGVNRRPSSITDAITAYRDARDRAERELEVTVPRDLAHAVTEVLLI